MANGGHKSDCQTNDNVSTNDEQGEGEAHDASDYHVPSFRVAVGGLKRTRNCIPQDNGDVST